MSEEASSGNFYPAWQPPEAAPQFPTGQEMVNRGNRCLELGMLGMTGAVCGSFVVLFGPETISTPIRIGLGILSLGNGVMSAQNLREYNRIGSRLYPGNYSRQPPAEE